MTTDFCQSFAVRRVVVYVPTELIVVARGSACAATLRCEFEESDSRSFWAGSSFTLGSFRE